MRTTLNLNQHLLSAVARAELTRRGQTLTAIFEEALAEKLGRDEAVDAAMKVTPLPSFAPAPGNEGLVPGVSLDALVHEFPLDPNAFTGRQHLHSCASCPTCRTTSQSQRGWRTSLAAGEETLLVADHVLAGFVRIVTMPAVFKEPSSIGSAVGFTDVLRTGPRTLAVRPEANPLEHLPATLRRRWSTRQPRPRRIHRRACNRARGRTCQCDADFARFPGLRWRHPLRAN